MAPRRSQASRERPPHRIEPRAATIRLQAGRPASRVGFPDLAAQPHLACHVQSLAPATVIPAPASPLPDASRGTIAPAVPVWSTQHRGSRAAMPQIYKMSRFRDTDCHYARRLTLARLMRIMLISVSDEAGGRPGGLAPPDRGHPGKGWRDGTENQGAPAGRERGAGGQRAGRPGGMESGGRARQRAKAREAARAPPPDPGRAGRARGPAGQGRGGREPGAAQRGPGEGGAWAGARRGVSVLLTTL